MAKYTKEELQHHLEQTTQLLSRVSDEVTFARLKDLERDLQEELRFIERDTFKSPFP